MGVIRKMRRANAPKPKGPTKYTVEQIGMILDAANTPEATFAVLVQCKHSIGTPGLVMSLETYIDHCRKCNTYIVKTGL